MDLGNPTYSPLAVTLLPLSLIAWLSWTLLRAFFKVYTSPLSRFPGPKLAALTGYWHAFIECVLRRSFLDVLVNLHENYGDIIRIGPNELHFANPQAYHDIYNNQNRWDKEKRLYHSFGEDRSSFGFLTYEEAKDRKDVLSKRFSARAVLDAHDLVQDKINALCEALARNTQKGQAVHVGYAFRCMTMDIITYLCFGKSVDAINEPNFQAPILLALDASTSVFVRFKHSEVYKNMIQKCPPNIAKKISPEVSGLIDLQQILGQQIKELSAEPRKLDLLPHDLTIYHVLISKDAHKSGKVPDAGELYEEAQALMFAGADTVGNAMMVASFFLGKKPSLQKRLKAELEQAWPDLDQDPPSLSELEKLPYLNAVIRESLRLSMGVVAGLLRVVPPQGATICGTSVPGGTIVSCSVPFVHHNKEIFENPFDFKPERWLEDPGLEKWLCSFSRGPRSCLGINLGWLEMRMTLVTVYRKFDVFLDASSPEKLEFKDAFLPEWVSRPVMAHFTPVQT